MKMRSHNVMSGIYFIILPYYPKKIHWLVNEQISLTDLPISIRMQITKFSGI
jgi:hypothetical protein